MYQLQVVLGKLAPLGLELKDRINDPLDVDLEHRVRTLELLAVCLAQFFVRVVVLKNQLLGRPLRDVLARVQVGGRHCRPQVVFVLYDKVHLGREFLVEFVELRRKILRQLELVHEEVAALLADFLDVFLFVIGHLVVLQAVLVLILDALIIIVRQRAVVLLLDVLVLAAVTVFTGLNDLLDVSILTTRVLDLEGLTLVFGNCLPLVDVLDLSILIGTLLALAGLSRASILLLIIIFVSGHLLIVL